MKANEASNLVCELQVLLAKALDSIAGKTTAGEVSYLVRIASHVNKVAAGYSELRRRRMTYASKIMIRPMMEAAAAAVAAVTEPTFLYQKMCSEYKEERKLLTEFCDALKKSKQPTQGAQELLINLEKSWKHFDQQFTRSHPHVTKNSCKPTFLDVLRAAGEEISWYAQYRLYCQFTHGTLRAASGALDAPTDATDDLVVARFLLTLLGHMKKHAPVVVPDLTPLLKRANDLMRQVQRK